MENCSICEAQYRMARTFDWIRTSNFAQHALILPSAEMRAVDYPQKFCQCTACSSRATTRRPTSSVDHRATKRHDRGSGGTNDSGYSSLEHRTLSNNDAAAVKPPNEAAAIIAERRHLEMLEKSCVQTLVDLRRRKVVTRSTQCRGLTEQLNNGDSSRKLVELARSHALRERVASNATAARKPPIRRSRRASKATARTQSEVASVAIAPRTPCVVPAKRLLRQFLLNRTNSLAGKFENAELLRPLQFCLTPSSSQPGLVSYVREMNLTSELAKLSSLVRDHREELLVDHLRSSS